MMVQQLSQGIYVLQEHTQLITDRFTEVLVFIDRNGVGVLIALFLVLCFTCFLTDILRNTRKPGPEPPQQQYVYTIRPRADPEVEGQTVTAYDVDILTEGGKDYLNFLGPQPVNVGELNVRVTVALIPFDGASTVTSEPAD